MINNIFVKAPLPKKLPKSLKQIIKTLQRAKGKKSCIKQASALLEKKYCGCRIATYTHLFNMWKSDIEYIWKEKGCLHCTKLNYLLRIMLIKSGFFKESDIRLRWTLIFFFSPHQYLQVKIGNRWINVDIWGHSYGIPLGDYAHGLH